MFKKFHKRAQQALIIKPPQNIYDVLKKNAAYKSYGIFRLFKCLLQFMEDSSDRELQRILQENTIAKWFYE